MNKPWYKSNTKWGGLLVGGGLILTSCGQFLLGEIDFVAASVGAVTGLGIILIAVGLRDAIEKK